MTFSDIWIPGPLIWTVYVDPAVKTSGTVVPLLVAKTGLAEKVNTCPGDKVTDEVGPLYVIVLTVPAVVEPHAVGVVASVQLTDDVPAYEVGGGHVKLAGVETDRPVSLITVLLPIVTALVPTFFNEKDSELLELYTEIPVIWSDEVLDAEPIRPKSAATTNAPTARTAPMMIKRSRLWEIARRFLLTFIFIDNQVFSAL